MWIKLLLLVFALSCNVGKSPDATALQGTTTPVSEQPYINLSTGGMVGVPESGGVLVIPFSLTKPAPANVTVTYSVTGSVTHSAPSNNDLTGVTGSISILAGQTSGTVAFTLVDDTIHEGNETLIFNLTGTSSSSVLLGQNLQKMVSIYDNDAIPELNWNSMATNTFPSDESNLGSVSVSYYLSHPSQHPITFRISRSGTATPGSDYFLLDTYTIPAYTTSGLITVWINDDNLNEGTEIVYLTLTSPFGATIGDDFPYHTFQIIDNESPAPPTVEFSIAADNETEGNTISIDVTLTGILETDQEIGFYVENLISTGVAGVDYRILNNPSQKLTFLANEPSPQIQTIQIEVLNDTIFELPELVRLKLYSTGLLVIGAQDEFDLTLTNTNPQPVISFTLSSVQVIESQSSHYLTLNLNTVSGADVTGSFTVGAPATATNGTDYVFPSLTFTIPAGSTSVNIPFTAIKDDLDEDNENFTVNLGPLTNAGNGAITTVTVTIVDDDLPPVVQFASNQSSGIDSENLISGTDNNPTVNISINLSKASGKTITIPIEVLGTAIGPSVATACSAFPQRSLDHNLHPQNVVIPPLTTSVNLSFEICDDDWYDPNETIVVKMGTPTNVLIGSISTHTVMIVEEDIRPSIRLGFNLLSGALGGDAIAFPDVILDEGTGPNRTAEIPVELVCYNTGTLAYDLCKAQETLVLPISISGTAISTKDYNLTSPSTVTILPGITDALLSFELIADELFEVDKTLRFDLPTNLSSFDRVVGEDYLLVTIQNDDLQPTISLEPTSGIHFDERNQEVSFTLRRFTSGVPTTVNLDLHVAAGFAEYPNDIDFQNKILTFPASEVYEEVEEVFTFNIIDDELPEDEEKIRINLTTTDYNILTPFTQMTIALNDYLQVAGSLYHNCALSTAGDVKCWGLRNMLGYGWDASLDPLSPYFNEFIYGDSPGDTLITLSSVNLGDSPYNVRGKKIVSSESSTCIMTSFGDVKCWGYKEKGVLANGDGTTSEYVGDDISEMGNNLPYVYIGERVVDIVAGTNHYCVLTESGKMKCWGSNEFGQLGQHRSVPNFTSASDNFYVGDYPGEMQSLDFIDFPDQNVKVKNIAAGANHSCAYLENNKMYCFGSNSSGQLGVNSNSPTIGELAGATQALSPSIIPSSAGYRVKDIVAGGDNTCVVYNVNYQNDYILCFGQTSNGFRGRADYQIAPDPYLGLGLGGAFGSTLFSTQYIPQPIPTAPFFGVHLGPAGLPANVLSIAYVSVGTNKICVNSLEGEIYCWGEAEYTGRDLPSTDDPIGFEGTSPDVAVIGTQQPGETWRSYGINVKGSTSCAVSGVDSFRCWGSILYVGPPGTYTDIDANNFIGDSPGEMITVLEQSFD